MSKVMTREEILEIVESLEPGTRINVEALAWFLEHRDPTIPNRPEMHPLLDEATGFITVPTTTAHLSNALWEAERLYVHAGSRIAALKTLRRAGGLCIRDARSLLRRMATTDATSPVVVD